MKQRSFLIFSLLVFTGFAPPKLAKTKITDGITVSLPKSLTLMTAEDIVQRYPSVRSPLAAFTNENRSADFSVNISATQWPDGNIELAKNSFERESQIYTTV